MRHYVTCFKTSCKIIFFAEIESKIISEVHPIHGKKKPLHEDIKLE